MSQQNQKWYPCRRQCVQLVTFLNDRKTESGKLIPQVKDSLGQYTNHQCPKYVINNKGQQQQEASTTTTSTNLENQIAQLRADLKVNWEHFDKRLQNLQAQITAAKTSSSTTHI